MAKFRQHDIALARQEAEGHRQAASAKYPPRSNEWFAELQIIKLQDTADNIFGRSFCGLGDGAATPVVSTLKFFRQDYLDYIEGRKAPRLSARELVGAH